MYFKITINGKRFAVDTSLKMVVKYNDEGGINRAIRFEEIYSKKIGSILMDKALYEKELEDNLEEFQRILKLINIS